MLNQFSRTELLIKEDGIKKLQNSKVAIFGIAGEVIRNIIGEC